MKAKILSINVITPEKEIDIYGDCVSSFLFRDECSVSIQQFVLDRIKSMEPKKIVDLEMINMETYQFCQTNHFEFDYLGLIDNNLQAVMTKFKNVNYLTFEKACEMCELKWKINVYK